MLERLLCRVNFADPANRFGRKSLRLGGLVAKGKLQIFLLVAARHQSATSEVSTLTNQRKTNSCTILT